MIQRLSPRALLVLDGAGALATAAGTALLAAGLLETGLPAAHLSVLAAVALGFAAFDALALARGAAGPTALRAIAALNLAYCAATALSCAAYAPALTRWAWLYFGLEWAIVVPLALFELRVAARAGASARG
ncbi:MAG: hypothetical protein JNM72_08775 [Deltaproteobacteria bacterium]|nr:hypothetical protein [Deltaproteobacteria bacterium]